MMSCKWRFASLLFSRTVLREFQMNLLANKRGYRFRRAKRKTLFHDHVSRSTAKKWIVMTTVCAVGQSRFPDSFGRNICVKLLLRSAMVCVLDWSAIRTIFLRASSYSSQAHCEQAVQSALQDDEQTMSTFYPCLLHFSNWILTLEFCNLSVFHILSSDIKMVARRCYLHVSHSFSERVFRGIMAPLFPICCSVMENQTNALRFPAGTGDLLSPKRWRSNILP